MCGRSRRFGLVQMGAPPARRMPLMASVPAQAAPSCRGKIRRYMLLLADAGGEAVHGRAAIQKMLYVLAKDTGDREVESGFGPRGRGPYSQQVADELDSMSRDGLVVEAPGRIALTAAGHAAADDADRGLDYDRRELLCECKRFFNGMTDEQLLLYTCLVYPDMVATTAAHADLLHRAADIVMGMVEEEKISSGHAAEILKMPFHDILDMMKGRGIAYLH